MFLVERRRLGLFALGFAYLALVGCSGVEMKKGDKKRAGRNTPHGPGILSGKDGEFVLYRREAEPEEADKEGAHKEGTE